VWSAVFRYGLEPRSAGASTHSLQGEILDRLAAEFAASGYDLKMAIRWAVLNESFTRSAELTDLASKDMPEAGEVPLFSRYYERPQGAPDAARLLAAASRIRASASTESARLQARTDWLVQANRAASGGAKAGKASKGAKASKKAAPPSILAPTDSKLGVHITVSDNGLIGKLAASKMSFEKKVEHLYLAALDRQPVAREVTAASELLAASGDHQVAALEDVWWALVNSNECVLTQ
jgi:hypothetical protein